MFDPFSMFCDGPVTPEGLLMMDDISRTEELNNAINFLYCHRNATIFDACKACNLKNLTQTEKKYIQAKVRWVF